MFDRYLNKPKETAESFTEDGWFKTGDFVTVCKDFLFLINNKYS